MDVSMSIERAEGRESGIEERRRRAVLRQLERFRVGQHCPSHCPSPSQAPSAVALPPAGPSRLGEPIDIKQVARILGCSPWSVRQTWIPKGLPHLRSGASSKLIFFTDQVVRWIERQQQGGQRR